MSIRVREQRYISSLLLEVIRLDGARVGAGVTVAIDNIDKLGAKPGLLGMGRLTVSVTYVSRERYFYRATKLCFFPPPPEYSKSDSYRSAEKKDSNESTIHTGPPNAIG